ncbi:MAG TPA: hypothetical protein VK066_20040 [Chloroflexota bacterium]|nr:hypothetical protein [Chloroflexota bacterium]
MGRRWELCINHMPPNLLNARLIPQARARITAEWRARAYVEARLARIPPLARVRLSAVFTRRALNVADPDGDMARLKPLADGLRDAGVIHNDTRRFVEWGPVTEEHGRPGVRLIVEELP